MLQLPSSLPHGLATLFETLAAAGSRSWLVGDSVCELAQGTLPSLYVGATTATPSEILRAFEYAVPLPGPRFRALIPTRAGPSLELFALPAAETIEAFLSCCDFAIRAMAFAPLRQEALDPYGGLDDLEKGVLRCVAPPHESLAIEPLRAFRAARLCAQLGFTPDLQLEEAMTHAASAIGKQRGLPVRNELCRMLLTSQAGRGISLLRGTGIERQLFRGVRQDAAALVDRLPQELVPRLVAWLRGCRAAAPLRHLRFGVERSSQVRRLLDLHPLDHTIRPSRDASVGKLMRQTDAAERELLFQLREHEIALAGEDPGPVAEKLAAVRAGIARIEAKRTREQARGALALDGAAVMAALGCGPGRRVGQALRHLAESVAREPGLNDRDTLLSLLEVWSRGTPE